jgi:hypothetical protein
MALMMPSGRTLFVSTLAASLLVALGASLVICGLVVVLFAEPAVSFWRWWRLWRFRAWLQGRCETLGSRWVEPTVDTKLWRLVWTRSDGGLKWPMALHPRKMSDVEVREWFSQGLKGM